MKKEDLDMIKSHMFIKSPEKNYEETKFTESRLDELMASAK